MSEELEKVHKAMGRVSLAGIPRLRDELAGLLIAILEWMKKQEEKSDGGK
jgi:hypothetical protein